MVNLFQYQQELNEYYEGIHMAIAMTAHQGMMHNAQREMRIFLYEVLETIQDEWNRVFDIMHGTAA